MLFYQWLTVFSYSAFNHHENFVTALETGRQTDPFSTESDPDLQVHDRSQTMCYDQHRYALK